MENKCLAAKYGNCCLIRASEEYCSYHKPNKNEAEAREFYEKLKEQAAIETDAKGKNKLVFKDDVEWRGYVFPKGYEDDIFRGATFKGRAYFGHSSFKGAANFGNANFEDAVFFREATFEDRASFLFANFKDEADFLHTTFECEVIFGAATFKGGVYFEGTTFKNEANFGGTTFKGEASFRGATFKGMAYFEDATFEGWTDFGGSSCIRNTSFSGVLFERSCSFANRKFGGRLLFTNTIFRQGVAMEDDWEKPEPEKYSLPQAEQEGCRIQKIAYEKDGQKDAADAMFVREMRAGRRDRAILYQEKDDQLTAHCKPLWDSKKPLRHKFCWDNLRSHITSKAEYLLVDLTSQYGTSWQRVIYTALVLIFSFACVYLIGTHLTSTYPHVGGIYSSRDTVLVKNFLNLLNFSVNTFIPVSYGDMYPDGLMKYVAGIQSLIGAFYIALFVVVFARKWMR